MKKYYLISIGITILFLGIAVAPLTQGILSKEPYLLILDGNTLYVGGTGPGNYTKIQDAIDNATDGDTVFVHNGKYYENLFLWKSIFLIGENRNNTFIYPKNVGDNENSTIFISVNNCSINGFTIFNNEFETGIIGINVYSSGNMIIDNSISKFEYGVYIQDDFDKHVFIGNNITNNEVSNCNYGIYVYANAENNIIHKNRIINNMEGMKLYYFANNSITENYIHSNTFFGIYLNLYSNCNIVTKNVCIENKYGIRFKSVKFNKIFLNRLRNNEIGLYSCCGSSNNILYYNSLIDNVKQAGDGFSNFWDNSTVGNYWNDYNGSDNNGDGIGDIPYPIPEGNNEDRYPLMEPYGNLPPKIPKINGPTNGKPRKNCTYKFNAIDSDGDDVRYHINWDDGYSEISSYNPSCTDLLVSHTWGEEGTYTITAIAEDEFGLIGQEGTLTVTIPRTKVIHCSFFYWFLERFLLLKRL